MPGAGDGQALERGLQCILSVLAAIWDSNAAVLAASWDCNAAVLDCSVSFLIWQPVETAMQLFWQPAGTALPPSVLAAS